MTPARRRRRRRGTCSDRPTAAPASTATCTPGPGPSWLACTRGCRPAAVPAASTARGLVRAERAPLAEHVHPAGVRRARGPASRRRPGRRSRPDRVELRRDHVRAQVGHLRGDLGREGHAAGLVARRSGRSRTCTRTWSCPGRAARRPASAGSPAAGRRWRPWSRRRSSGCRLPGRAGPPSGPRTRRRARRRRPGARASRRTPAAPPGRPRRRSRRRRAPARPGPVQATRPASITSAAAARDANGPGPRASWPGGSGAGDPPGGAFVTSSPMLVIRRLTCACCHTRSRWRASGKAEAGRGLGQLLVIGDEFRQLWPEGISAG